VAKEPIQKKPEPANAGITKISTIRLEPLENASVYYVNYIEVAHSTQDFSLICARIPSKFTYDEIKEANNVGALVVEPEVQVIVPTTLIPGLIRALTTQKENYEKAFGVQIKEVGTE
jgi:hypothetical protein